MSKSILGFLQKSALLSDLHMLYEPLFVGFEAQTQTVGVFWKLSAMRGAAWNLF